MATSAVVANTMEVTKAVLQYCCRPDAPLAPATEASVETNKYNISVLLRVEYLINNNIMKALR